MEKFYIATAIDYVNGAPHIGHAYEKIANDVFAKHYKQRDFETYALTGSDEHGIKIEKTAKENNMSPKEFCDMNVDKFKKCWATLDIEYNRYIRTTDKDHEEAVKKIFKKLIDNGDIYKHAYKGLYCNGCESFLNERDLTEDGLCPDHKCKPQEVEEENYFFKLSKYKEAIKNHIKNNPNFILPSFRVNEVLNQLEDIQDISVSRAKSSVTWGIPVPDDEEQIIYVWIDALSNYITALGYLSEDDSDFKKYWPADIHNIGKDILKFHSIYWIGLLMALGLELPKTILAHGWITIDDTKMGKSLGNVISPIDVLDNFELEKADALRYFFMTTTPFGKDGNYSDEDFKAKVNSDLANNLGNLLNRTLSMLNKYTDGVIEEDAVTNPDNELAVLAAKTKTDVQRLFDERKITEAADSIINLVDAANKYVNDTAPWALAKENPKECAKVIYNVLETMRFVAVLIYPFVPNISQDIWSQLSCDGQISDVKYDDINWNGLKTGKIISKEDIKPVFLRLDSELAGDKKRN